MKKGLVFILGLITGMILTAITLFVISKEYSKERGPVLNMSEQQIPFITAYYSDVGFFENTSCWNL